MFPGKSSFHLLKKQRKGMANIAEVSFRIQSKYANVTKHFSQQNILGPSRKHKFRAFLNTNG